MSRVCFRTSQRAINGYCKNFDNLELVDWIILKTFKHKSNVKENYRKIL